MALDERQLPPNWVPPPPEPGAPPPEPEELERQEDLHAALIERRLKLRAQEEKEAHCEERAQQLGQMTSRDRRSRGLRMVRLGAAGSLAGGLIGLFLAGGNPVAGILFAVAGAAGGALLVHFQAGPFTGLLSFGFGGVALILFCVAAHWMRVSADAGSCAVFFSTWLYLMGIGWALGHWAEQAESEERKNPF